MIQVNGLTKDYGARRAIDNLTFDAEQGEIVGFLEQRYQITIEDEELVPENLDSIERLVRFVSRKIEMVA